MTRPSEIHDRADSEIERLTRERDEARAELARLHGAGVDLREACAEVARVWAEREACAKLIEDHLAKVDERIACGKGTWPGPDYVRDEIWSSWSGEAYALRGAIRAIRSRSSSKTGGDNG